MERVQNCAESWHPSCHPTVPGLVPQYLSLASLALDPHGAQWGYLFNTKEEKPWLVLLEVVAFIPTPAFVSSAAWSGFR